MHAVEDLVADCASTASARTLSWDLSRHGKPSEHMTVGIYKKIMWSMQF